MAKKNKINCDAILINRLIKIRFNITKYTMKRKEINITLDKMDLKKIET
jgi:hypothetical protein